MIELHAAVVVLRVRRCPTVVFIGCGGGSSRGARAGARAGARKQLATAADHSLQIPRKEEVRGWMVYGYEGMGRAAERGAEEERKMSFKADGRAHMRSCVRR